MDNMHQEFAVFDFDGTLVSKDSGHEFNKWLIRKSLVRCLFLFFASPIIILLVSFPKIRLLGLNILCYIATAFQRTSLFLLRDQFVKYYFHRSGGFAYAAGLNELWQHQQEGRTVLIVSGCSTWLLYGIVKSLEIKNVKLIGSQQKQFFGGIIIEKHCYHRNKLEMVSVLKEGAGTWVAGYSDSEDDIPLLGACIKKVLINVSGKKYEKFKKYLQPPIETREWHSQKNKK